MDPDRHHYGGRTLAAQSGPRHLGSHRGPYVPRDFARVPVQSSGRMDWDQAIIQAIEMREGPAEFSSTATSESFDTAGTLIGSVCATAIGQRVE